LIADLLLQFRFLCIRSLRKYRAFLLSCSSWRDACSLCRRPACVLHAGCIMPICRLHTSMCRLHVSGIGPQLYNLCSDYVQM